MHVRCAYFVGDVAAENQAKFNRFFEEEAVPRINKFPGIRSVRLLRSEWREEGAPNLYQFIELTFDDAAAIETALASEERAANIAHMQNSGIMDLFDGKVVHVNFEVAASR
ncbi:MAG: EthD family reductase [Alphaproteobacteria bacterium]|nr:EthD family reductase [Alphaproteobacteria bacterium]